MSSDQLTFIRNVRNLVHSHLLCCSEVCAFIACQSALETAFGTSAIFIENHNLFGMKVPMYRINLVIASNREHACYNDLQDSLLDYVYWLIQNHFEQRDLNSLNAFVKQLKRTSFNPKMETYVKSIKLLYDVFKASVYEDLSL